MYRGSQMRTRKAMAMANVRVHCSASSRPSSDLNHATISSTMPSGCCVRVCVCVFMYMCIHTLCVCVCLCVCVYVCVCVCDMIYTCTHTHITYMACVPRADVHVEAWGEGGMERGGASA